MFHTSGKPASERFYPETRGWAALRLSALAPPLVRGEVEARAARAPRASSFAGDALRLVSLPPCLEWARRLATDLPALGVPAGPAAIARLWAARLLAPESAIASYWPSVVESVWRVVAPALRMVGLAARGPRGEDLRHEVASPLALVLLASLAAGRKDFRLLGDEDSPGREGPPFGWAPGPDPLPAVIRYLVLDQVPGGFRSHAFLTSPLARTLRGLGLAAPVVIERRRCPRCRTDWPDADGDGCCPHCHSALATVRARRLVVRTGFGAAGLAAAGASAPQAVEVAPWDKAEAHELRRACLGRALGLWHEVIQGRRYGVTAMVVLGVLAGVEPLEGLASHPAPAAGDLDRLIEALAEAWLDRPPIVARASAALGPLAARLGRPSPPPMTAPHVGVLATRFRRAVLGV